MDLMQAIAGRKKPILRESKTLGCPVYVRRLSYGFLMDNTDAQAGPALLCEGIVQADGSRVFSEVQAVRELDAEVIRELSALVAEVNNFGIAVEEAAKNSKPPRRRG